MRTAVAVRIGSRSSRLVFRAERHRVPLGSAPATGSLNHSAINGWKACICATPGRKGRSADPSYCSILSTASHRSQPRLLQQAYSLSRTRRRVHPFPHRSRSAPVASVVEPPWRSCGLRMRTSSTCAASAGREGLLVNAGAGQPARRSRPADTLPGRCSKNRSQTRLNRSESVLPFSPGSGPRRKCSACARLT